MTWDPGRLDQPLKPDKGLRGGSCNRQACQDPGADFYNRGTDKWYCDDCAGAINSANRDYTRNGRHAPLCIPASLYDADETEREWADA
jgi:hypothetical protein